MKAAYGKVHNIKPLPSQGVTRIEVELPIESHIAATDLLFGRDVLVTVSPQKFPAYGVLGSAAAQDDTSDSAGAGSGPSEPALVAEPAGGVLAKLAGRWCREPGFFQWLIHTYDSAQQGAVAKITLGESTEEVAAYYVRKVCGVASRAELDHDERAAAIFHEKIRLPYMAHLARMR